MELTAGTTGACGAAKREDMRWFVIGILVALGLALPAATGMLAWADAHGARHLAAGVRISGVDVGGRTPQDAERVVREVVAPAVRPPVRVRAAGHTFTLTAKAARVELDVAGAVRRAMAVSREGSFLERGWRELTDDPVDADIGLQSSVDRDAVARFVRRIHIVVSRRPVDARLRLRVDDVDARRARPGRRLADREGLVRRVTVALRRPGGTRLFRARLARIAPGHTVTDVWKATPVAVTVSRAERRARVFRRGRLVASYRAAVGTARHPTPTGRFEVQSLLRDPAWNAPDSAWAGELAGDVIPAGDRRNPLVDRWIGFAGAVGFHGTRDLGSLGRSASHGCVRLRPEDVRDLFDRVSVGTPVLVA